MPFLEEFEKVLEKNLPVCLSKVRRQYQVHLVETGSKAKLRKLTLDLPEHSLVLNIEKASIQGLFSKGVGSNKRCDYVVFSELKDIRYMIFIELKSESPDENSYTQQFKGAECLIKYCEIVMKKFVKKDKLFNGFDNRYVLFYRQSLNLQPSRADMIPNTSPENAYMFANPDLEGSIPLEELIIK